MALIGPILDDRTWEQLRAELVQRIPTYTPEWTNHNAGDPGIALLELFAFLGESLLYRFNQIPETTKLAFLRLLGVEPHPAQAATVLAVLQTERPEGVQVLKQHQLAAGDVQFETDDEVFAWPLEVLGAGRLAVSAPTRGDLPEAQYRHEVARRQDAVARLGITDPSKAQFYDTQLLPADPGAVPLDVAGTLDRALWVALLARDTTDLATLAGGTVFLGVAFDETVQRPFTLDALDAAEAGRYRSARLDEDPPPTLWRIWTGLRPADPEAALRKLEVAPDHTRGMTTTGVVGVTVPEDLGAIAQRTRDAFAAGGPAPAGGQSEPPPLEDPEQAARLIAWLQVSRPRSATDAIHRIRWVGVNAVAATQVRTAQPELLGTGTGEPDQVYRLVNANVVRGSVRVEVEEAGGWTGWKEVDSFAATRLPEDRHVVVDHQAGLVRFGPGGQRGGQVPQLGERIRVRSYRYGGGAGGNVPAGAVASVPGVAGVEVTNPLPAAGGKDAESLAEAVDRIPGEVHRHDRAVTMDDFRALAAEVTGVARAEALTLFHPDTPAVPAAGVVSVIVFPLDDPSSPGAPLPDRALLRRVAGYLDQRRLLTTELYVIPPEYVPVAVSAGVAVADGYQVDAVRRWVELILRQFLAPVPPYGPDGQGWRLGRAIRRAELEAVAVQVDGVEYVQRLRLAVAARSGTRTVWEERDLVTLQRHQVPELAAITVVQGDPLEPGAGYRPQQPTVPVGTVLVPLPREVC
jgi:predicted phage baseplate assembly protein